jgi:GAF domain-containing protein
VAIENARLHREIQQGIEELTLLNRVGRTVTSSLNLEQVLTTVMEETVRALGTEAGAVLLLDEKSGELVFEAVVGPRSEEIEGRRLSIGQGFAGWVAQEDQRLLVPNARDDPRFLPDIEGAAGFVARSVLAVPLQLRGRVIGVIEAVDKIRGGFSQPDVRLGLSASVRPCQCR